MTDPAIANIEFANLNTEMEERELENEFRAAFDLFQGEAHETAIEKGWWDDPAPVNVGEKIALMHSELSEALEGARHGNPPSDKIPEFSALEEEFADTIIRIMDLAEHMNLRVSDAIVAKARFNKKRPYKHGKVF